MGYKMYPKDYANYIRRAYEKIHSEKDYLSELDAATGDGDHWANVNMGFSKLVEQIPELETMPFDTMFQKIAMTMMTVIGGSSGVLYASAYMEAGNFLRDKAYIDCETMCAVLDAMLRGIMRRGNAAPGMKTMVDTLNAAVLCYQACLNERMDENKLLDQVKAAAYQGQQSTIQMEAVRGRAYYQSNKGVGHLDPGAVSMYYQIESLVDEIKSSCFA